jgi:hypothetical protein
MLLEVIVGAFTVGFDEETLECCSDHLERYVMNRLAPVAFAITETSVEDAILCRRMQLLSFLRPQVSSSHCVFIHMMTMQALDIKYELRNPDIWRRAKEELRKINFYKTPGEKIECVVRRQLSPTKLVVKLTLKCVGSMRVCNLHCPSNLYEQRKADQRGTS